MKHYYATALLLRLGIATVFLYAAFAATVQPFNWIGYIPPFVRTLAPANILLMGFSFYQVILALWVLSGWKTLWAALVAAATLTAIMLANAAQIDILFRDIAIFFASLALAVSSRKK